MEKWTQTAHYPGHGRDFYETPKVQFGHDSHRTFIQGRVETRVNGPGTAYATVTITVEWASISKWGLCINKHFLGSHAGQKARAWCNYLIANPPSNWQETIIS